MTLYTISITDKSGGTDRVFVVMVISAQAWQTIRDTLAIKFGDDADYRVVESVELFVI